MLKEIILPTNVNTFLFILAPVITFIGTMMYWAVLPLSKGITYTDFNVGVLFFYAISYTYIFTIFFTRNITFSCPTPKTHNYFFIFI